MTNIVEIDTGTGGDVPVDTVLDIVKRQGWTMCVCVGIHPEHGYQLVTSQEAPEESVLALEYGKKLLMEFIDGNH